MTETDNRTTAILSNEKNWRGGPTYDLNLYVKRNFSASEVYDFLHRSGMLVKLRTEGSRRTAEEDEVQRSYLNVEGFRMGFAMSIHECCVEESSFHFGLWVYPGMLEKFLGVELWKEEKGRSSAIRQFYKELGLMAQELERAEMLVSASLCYETSEHRGTRSDGIYLRSDERKRFLKKIAAQDLTENSEFVFIKFENLITKDS